MTDFIRVADVAEIPDPGKTLVEVAGDMVAVFHVAGVFYAIDDVCTHDGGPLADGELRDHKIACPRHGAKFDIRTGAALSMPAVRSTRAHDVKVEDGGVWVRLRTESGGGRPPLHGTIAEAVAQPSPVMAAVPPAGPAGGERAAGGAEIAAGPLCEDRVREMLKEVKDPELFVNIVDLGLIYGVAITPSAEAPGKLHVAIDMTMTSPACPAGPQLIADTKRCVGASQEVAAVEVRIVMDPPWTPDRMTDAARDHLGIF
jgi:metal-sulfur cluster biosynthetic enzyme/nitrite reductase/ring-hydroxylating ferredoxin subunit